MYRVKRQFSKWIKGGKKQGYLFPKKQDWLEQHSPSRQSKRSHINPRKAPKGR